VSGRLPYFLCSACQPLLLFLVSFSRKRSEISEKSSPASRKVGQWTIVLGTTGAVVSCIHQLDAHDQDFAGLTHPAHQHARTSNSCPTTSHAEAHALGLRKARVCTVNLVAKIELRDITLRFGSSERLLIKLSVIPSRGIPQLDRASIQER
jgi:hypothetical protein